jgi:hypothetical protein
LAITLHFILLLLALVCFGLVALNVTVKQISLIGLGLALWVAAVIFP